MVSESKVSGDPLPGRLFAALPGSTVAAFVWINSRRLRRHMQLKHPLSEQIRDQEFRRRVSCAALAIRPSTVWIGRVFDSGMISIRAVSCPLVSINSVRGVARENHFGVPDRSSISPEPSGSTFTVWIPHVKVFRFRYYFRSIYVLSSSRHIPYEELCVDQLY